MQPFLTPRSRIFYAGRMGESTNAYQSPSKDLKYINNRIAAHSQLPAPQPVPVPQVRSVLCRLISNGQASSITVYTIEDGAKNS